VPYGFAYPDLPILARREDILKALKDHQALVVQGGTGSGKTTQLPKFLLDADLANGGMIGLTQPRRIAALSIADRLRQETARPELIGAKIRFHEDLPPQALVKVMTDGILLQEFRRDPLLRQYACIILDEAHERSLNVDILLGIFRNLLPRRPGFRLIVTSATLDADRFAEYLATSKESGSKEPGSKPSAPNGGSSATASARPAASPSGASPSGASPSGASPSGASPAVPVIEVEGRQFPVSIEYWDISGKDTEDTDGTDEPARVYAPVEAAAIAIRELQARKPDNLLAFLPTEKEIHELHRELEKDLGKAFEILPLYSRLAPGDQKRVFADAPRPKIILATNIAETSLTIPGIGYVVDTGLARISRYHAQTKIQGLPIERISQASARQRSGRAGRVKAGTCVRLYSEEDYKERIEFTEPEVLRSNLANVVLHLLALGLDVDAFPFPDPPAPAALKGAFRQLHELGAVDGPGSDARLTEEGRKLSRLPVDVAIGKILLKAQEFGVLQPALIIAAGITVQDPRITPREEPERGKAVGLHRRFEDPRSDFIGVLTLWAWIHRNWGDRYTQRKLRALCVENFISYNRVREWMDLAEQFSRLLKVTLEPGKSGLEGLNADALHKAILGGFLPFLGRRKPEDTAYRLAGDKEAHIHPGSSLSKRKPEWIVAGEVRQTSRVFIYRACEIKPAWVEELAPEACKRTYANVAWNQERGFVEALERVTYKGFAIRQDRRVNYESVAPEECAALFWREGALRDAGGHPFPFRDANSKVLESLAALESKARVRGLVPDEEAQVDWYRMRAPGVTSRVGLQRFIEETGDKALRFALKDWAAMLEGSGWEAWSDGAGAIARTEGATAGAPADAVPGDHALHRMFPDRLNAGGHTYRLGYRFDFGDPLDGISLEASPEGLASLSMEALFGGIPGWRKWIFEFCLDRLNAKAAQSARGGVAAFAEAWGEASAPREGHPPSPAAALAQVFASRPETSGSPLSLPSVWPAYLQIHVFVRSPNGRKFLFHADPAFGDAEFFAAARRLLFGESPSEKGWKEWAAGALADFGKIPPALPWRGFYFGPAPLGTAAGRAAGACGFFADPEEAAFHHRLAQSRASRAAASGAEEKPRASLASFFTKRIQALMDAWNCPDRPRKETAVLREALCAERLPDLYIAAFGAEALVKAEKELPPPRPASLAKPGTQVKSLAALGQAAARSADSTAWAGVALALGAALDSREGFAAWFRFFAQPPLEARSGIAEFFRKATALPDWEDLLLSPYYAAWISRIWQAAVTGVAPVGSVPAAAMAASAPEAGFRFRGGEAELIADWKASREAAERIRKGAKALRDRFCARIAASGQSVAGLPKDQRAALDALDRALPWAAKAEAELGLEMHLNRQAARTGNVTATGDAKAGAAGKERQERQLKDLSGRFKKL
jgi:HrpA-like RNA helicase